MVAISLTGCNEKKSTPKGSASGAAAKKGMISGDMFNYTIESLNNLEQTQPYNAQDEIKNQILELQKSSESATAKKESTLLSAWPESDSMRQIVDRLNGWIRAQQPPEWKRDPMLDELSEPLKTLPIIANLDKMEIGPFDGYYLQQAVFVRDVSLVARGKSVDDRLRAGRMFDWTVRNIQLEPETAEHIPRFPWETLFFGQGTAWERAWVFVLLARQEGLDAVVLAIDKKGEDAKKDESSLQPWCVAVRIDDKAYLFDPLWGLPIPGPNGLKKDERGQLDIVPASLDQLLADESLLARMNADAEHPYKITQADLKNVVALVEASPTSLSRRMKVIESHVQGKQKMSLTTSASEQAAHWKSMPGVTAVKLWTLPYETIQRRSELTPLEIAKLLVSYLPFYAMPVELLRGEEVMQKASETPKDMQDVYKGKATSDKDAPQANSPNSLQDTDSQKYKRMVSAVASLNAKYTAPLYKGRVLHLKGQLSGDIGDKSALDYYLTSLPSTEEMNTIQLKRLSQVAASLLAEKKDLSDEERNKLIQNIVEAVVTGKTLRDEESQRMADAIRQNAGPFVEEELNLILMGKMNAGYWLGLATYERGNYSSAHGYFGKRTLLAWPNGPWTTGAIYNLGRTLEAQGDFEQATKAYRSSSSAAGQWLRAKWLQEVNEQKAEAP
jgi:hypothetical protein